MRAPPDTFRFRYFHKQWKKELINFTFDKLFPQATSVKLAANYQATQQGKYATPIRGSVSETLRECVFFSPFPLIAAFLFPVVHSLGSDLFLFPAFLYLKI